MMMHPNNYNEQAARSNRSHTVQRQDVSLRAFGKPIVFWQFTVTLDEDDDETPVPSTPVGEAADIVQPTTTPEPPLEILAQLAPGTAGPALAAADSSQPALAAADAALPAELVPLAPERSDLTRQCRPGARAAAP
jgi:hypothetical protein